MPEPANADHTAPILRSCRERFLLIPLVLVAALFGYAVLATAQEAPAEELPSAGGVIETAPVMIDGSTLFFVRGVQSYPAPARARLIEQRIRQVAADPAIAPDAIIEVDEKHFTNLVAGRVIVATLVDADAIPDGVERQVLARVFREKIRKAVSEYRKERTAKAFVRMGLSALLITGAFALGLLLLLRWSRRITAALEERYHTRIEALRIQSLEIVQARRIWTVIMGTARAVRGTLVLLLLYFYLELALSLFPWTRAIAARLLDLVLSPLTSLTRSFLAFIPDLIVIAVFVIVLRYALKVLRLVFLSVEHGTIKLAGFEPAWAPATYKIARLLVLMFGMVVIYPYIPGSGSAAFKGVSVFLGIVFSLGSSSTIANVIAGYSLIYRRAFQVGDRVQIGEVTGDVIEMRMQVTHLRTVKNEEVTIPNSVILSTPVVNYSSQARQSGLILHTTVTIGYDVPWRQVHAMLLLAAERTTGLRADPKPFVLQKELSDFYVAYELNVSTDRPDRMPRTYSDLHQNILDAFNEHGVQIMSPHYEGDPAHAKVVPRTQWYAPPAEAEKTKETKT